MTASPSIAAKRTTKSAAATAPRVSFPGYAEARIVSGIAGVLAELGPTTKVLDVGDGAADLAESLSANGVALTGVAVGAAPKLKRADAALFLDSLTREPDAAKAVTPVLKVVRAGGMVLRGTIESEDARETRAYEAIGAIAKEAGTELPARRGDIAGFVNTVEAAGAWLEVVELGRWIGTTSGQRVLDRWSPGLNDEVLAKARAAVEEIFGNLESETEAERSFSLMVARLP